MILYIATLLLIVMMLYMAAMLFVAGTSLVALFFAATAMFCLRLFRKEA